VFSMWRGFRAALVAASATLIFAASASASSFDLVSPTTETVQGLRTSDGSCSYSYALSLIPGQSAAGLKGVSDDTSTCRATIQTGQAINVVTGDSAGSSAAGSDVASPTSTAGGQVIAAATTHSAGYYDSWTYDPAGIMVNEVRTSVNWYWNGTVVSNANCGYYTWWLSGDGWSRVGDSSSCKYASDYHNVSGTQTVHYKNPYFCAATSTDVYYSPNKVSGGQHGGLGGSVNWSDSGNCASLLNPYSVLVRTLN
jgi:hypothetical protein